jgi:hypothetical protein
VAGEGQEGCEPPRRRADTVKEAAMLRIKRLDDRRAVKRDLRGKFDEKGVKEVRTLVR